MDVVWYHPHSSYLISAKGPSWVDCKSNSSPIQIFAPWSCQRTTIGWECRGTSSNGHGCKMGDCRTTSRTIICRMPTSQWGSSGPCSVSPMDLVNKIICYWHSQVCLPASMSSHWAWDSSPNHNPTLSHTHQSQTVYSLVSNPYKRTPNHADTSKPYTPALRKTSPCFHWIAWFSSNEWTSIHPWWNSSQRKSSPWSGRRIIRKRGMGDVLSTGGFVMFLSFINAPFRWDSPSSLTLPHSTVRCGYSCTT